jgi:maltooligosyltrehalose synthase
MVVGHLDARHEAGEDVRARINVLSEIPGNGAAGSRSGRS